jgi:hypothetical protein
MFKVVLLTALDVNLGRNIAPCIKEVTARTRAY